MQNRFGPKDLLIITLGTITILLLVLSMIQEDRRFAETRALDEKVGNVERTVAQLRRIVETQPTTNAADLERLLGALQLQQGATTSPGQNTPTNERDTSWARPGVEITWPETWGPVNDPKRHPSYQEGGTFTEVFEAKMPKVTPHVFSDVYGRRVVNETVCEQLANYNSDTLKFEGVLAEAWQYDPDGLWLRVKIRDEARWSDGLPVTAEDVRFTFLDYIGNPEIEAENIRSTMPQILGEGGDVRVIDENVVEFIFNEAVYTNLTVALRTSIIPKHFYSQFTPSQINQGTSLLMGSGPYRLETIDVDNQWEPGSDLVLVRNENYWGRRPAIDRHRFGVIVDNVARLTSFENGNADMVRGTVEQFAEKEADPRFNEIGSAHAWANMKSGYTFIAWNNGERNGRLTPFHDARVRRAMTHLLDRDRINRDFYEGLATVAYGPFNPATPQANPILSPLPYDIEEARRLLTEAGWIDRDNDGILENERGDEFSFTYTHSTGSSLAPKIGRYLIDQCARVGIRCEIDVVEWAILTERMDNRDFDAITLAWSQSSPESDPRQLWHTAAIRDAGYNFAQYRNERVDELIDQGRRELDEDKRMAIWHEIHTHIHRDQPYTFLLFVPWIRFVSDDVENFREYNVGLDKHSTFIMDN